MDRRRQRRLLMRNLIQTSCRFSLRAVGRGQSWSTCFTASQNMNSTPRGGSRSTLMAMASGGCALGDLRTSRSSEPVDAPRELV
jgi:hypothetical protein